MDFSGKDCIYSRISFCQQLVSFATNLKANIFQNTANQYNEQINVLKKFLFILSQSHTQYFHGWVLNSEIRINQLINLKKFFFNPKLLMTLKAQSSVKSQYNPYFDYFRKSDKNCIEQFSRNPLDAFEFFQNGIFFKIYNL